MKIQYYKKGVYGKQLNYILDEEQANYWALITDNISISDKQMELMTKLTGVEFERVFEPEAPKHD
jgi:hypothetical protein